MRQGVWACFERYQELLAQNDFIDWADWPLLYEKHVAHPRRRFDHVIVDEAQDFTAVQLRVIQRFLDAPAERPKGQGLFLVGDSAQSLRTRGFAWRQAGIEISGRSWTLKRNYRNARLVAKAASALLANNSAIVADDDFVPTADFASTGMPPTIIECQTTNLEWNAVIEQALQFAQDQAFRFSDMAILCPSDALCREGRDRLDVAALPVKHFRDGRFDLFDNAIKILTLDSVKGLEFPIVFIVGLHENTLPRRNWSSSDREQALLNLERERNRLYVGMTRAAEVLFLVTSGQQPSRFLKEIDAHCWRRHSSDVMTVNSTGDACLAAD
jgi:superfamily I DNA/RNA helicase